MRKRHDCRPNRRVKNIRAGFESSMTLLSSGRDKNSQVATTHTPNNIARSLPHGVRARPSKGYPRRLRATTSNAQYVNIIDTFRVRTNRSSNTLVHTWEHTMRKEKQGNRVPGTEVERERERERLMYEKRRHCVEIFPYEIFESRYSALR